MISLILQAGVIAAGGDSIRGPRTYLVPYPIDLPLDGIGLKLMDPATQGDAFADLSVGQVPNVIGQGGSSPPFPDFTMKVVGLSGEPSNKVTWKADNTHATRRNPPLGGDQDDPTAMSALLRIDDQGVAALTHRASITIWMPWSGAAYLYNYLVFNIFSRCIAPTGYKPWKDTLRVTLGKGMVEFNINGQLGPVITGFTEPHAYAYATLISGKKALYILEASPEQRDHIVVNDTVTISGAANPADNATYTVFQRANMSGGVRLILNDATPWASTRTTATTGVSCYYSSGKRKISATTVWADALAHIAANDTVTVSGSPNPADDGVYTVASKSGSVLTTTNATPWNGSTPFTASGLITFAASGALIGGYMVADVNYAASGPLQTHLPRPRIHMTYPGNPDSDSTPWSGYHEETLWFRDIFSIDPATRTWQVAERVEGIFNTAQNITVANASEFEITQAVISTYPIKIERILSDPYSGVPEQCGIVDSYFGDIQMHLNRVTP
jgi:hypothetical protein